MTADQSRPDHAHARPGMTEGPSCAQQMTLPAAAPAARLARQATRQVLASWQVAHLEETAVLLVSELVANVVRHARTTSTMILRLETAGTWLRIEVQDGDPRCPQPRTPAGLDESGFGFVLVDTLADKWGVRQIPRGKAVWAELDTGHRGEPGISTDRQRGSCRASARGSASRMSPSGELSADDRPSAPDQQSRSRNL